MLRSGKQRRPCTRPSSRSTANHLATLIRTFNRLDFDKGSIERETIMDALEVIALASGVDEEAWGARVDGGGEF